MIKANVSNSVSRGTAVVSDDTTISAAFEQAGVSMTGGTVCADGRVLSQADLDRPISDFATGDEITLLAMAKMVNA